MDVLIYVDGGEQRGLGHVMRSIAIAEEVTRRRGTVRWIGILDSSAVRILSTFGFDPSCVVRCESENALGALIAELELRRPHVLHIDSYDLQLEREQLPSDLLVSAMQDYPYGVRSADVVIDANLRSEMRLGATDPQATVVLPGLPYAALRSDVRAAFVAQVRPRQIDRVLVLMGGTDPLRLCERVLKELSTLERSLEVTVISKPDRHRSLCALGAHHQLNLLPFVHNLAALAAEHDLVVTASGTSLWELCHIGVPMAVICAVDNQAVSYEALTDAGAAFALGEASDLRVGALGTAIATRPVQDWADQAEIAQRMVDGLGVWRIVSSWETVAENPKAPTMELAGRRATMDDARNLWTWRNDPATLQWSRTNSKVAYESHLSWLKDSLDRDDRLLMVVEHDSQLVGVVRWDRVAIGQWEVSVTLAPEARGKGLAVPTIIFGQREIRNTVGNSLLCIATVHQHNVASLRLFERAGYLPFRPVDTDGFAGYARWVR